MPIRPENRKRYPENWPDIVATIRARSGNASYTAGHMVDRQGCIIAGAGMAAILEQANPGLTVQPECKPMGVAA